MIQNISPGESDITHPFFYLFSQRYIIVCIACKLKYNLHNGNILVNSFSTLRVIWSALRITTRGNNRCITWSE